MCTNILFTILLCCLWASRGLRLTSVRSLRSSSTCLQDAILRNDFEILNQEAYPGKPLVFLDSAASSQKPRAVIDAMNKYYKEDNANVHRGAYSLANRATEMYEEARDELKQFINANQREEIIFTRGATEAINLVAQSWAQRLKEGDEIVLSVMEHHSNMVPWQMVAERSGAVVKYARLTESQELDMEHYRSLLSERTKLVAVAHASNVLGVVNPVADIIRLAKATNPGCAVLLDACQSVPHMPVDVQALGCDFLAASGHKMCGPTGVGFLWAKYEHLLSMPPVDGGGEMIDTVTLEGSTYALPPSRFEPGTPAIAECVGLAAAIKYLRNIGMDEIYAHEKELGKYLYERLEEVNSECDANLELYGPSAGSGGRTGLVSFNSRNVHATDMSFFLDQEGVCVRTGHHCCQPLHNELGARGSMRASLYFYNNKQDVDTFIDRLKDVITMFKSMEGQSILEI
jgi:cysteine desulfurase / selenocysteine lyase